jgi:hypothetical protein
VCVCVCVCACVCACVRASSSAGRWSLTAALLVMTRAHYTCAVCFTLRRPLQFSCQYRPFTIESLFVEGAALTPTRIHRAWCQAELLVARAFCAMPFVMRVTGGFKHEEQLHVSYQEHLLPDPSNKDTAMITDEKDRPTIQGLTECARGSRAFTYAQCTRNILKAGKVDGGILTCFSIGTMPLLLRRSVKPGQSMMHMVEPCATKPPKSWRRFRLWLQLNPDSTKYVIFYFIFLSYPIIFIIFALEYAGVLAYLR